MVEVIDNVEEKKKLPLCSLGIVHAQLVALDQSMENGLCYSSAPETLCNILLAILVGK